MDNTRYSSLSVELEQNRERILLHSIKHHIIGPVLESPNVVVYK